MNPTFTPNKVPIDNVVIENDPIRHKIWSLAQHPLNQPFGAIKGLFLDLQTHWLD
jgi:hypothetical protein